MNTSSTPLGNRAIRDDAGNNSIMPSLAHGDHITKYCQGGIKQEKRI